jgi:hypothetical protein
MAVSTGDIKESKLSHSRTSRRDTTKPVQRFSNLPLKIAPSYVGATVTPHVANLDIDLASSIPMGKPRMGRRIGLRSPGELYTPSIAAFMPKFFQVLAAIPSAPAGADN